MPPDLIRNLLHSFENAAIPANFRRDGANFPMAANDVIDSTEDGTIFRTKRK